MKVLSRDFTTREKVLLLVLVILILVLAYVQFVDRPVRNGIEEARAEAQVLTAERDAINALVGRLDNMQQEMDEIDASGRKGVMGSYNNSKAELDILNDILKDTESYSVALSGVTRAGDQIRRGFDLQFTVKNYASVKSVLTLLSESPYRCLIGDTAMKEEGEGYSVVTTVTFYETMVGGTPDEGLPEDSAK